MRWWAGWRSLHNVDPPYTHNYPHVPPSSAFQSMTMEGSVHYPPNTRDHLIGERPPPHPPPHSYCPAFHLMLGKLRAKDANVQNSKRAKGQILNILNFRTNSIIGPFHSSIPFSYRKGILGPSTRENCSYNITYIGFFVLSIS